MQWIPSRLRSKKVWSPGLFTLSIEAPGVKPFEPGQFLQVGIQGTDKHIHRPYSVASPHGPVLEFFIVLVEDGQLTPILWNMEPGTAIDVSESAAGSFTLSHAPAAETLWMIGTGTGLAPYIAMLRYEKTWQRYQKIAVVHGVRHGKDLAYTDEMANYAERYPGRFKYQAVASREETEGAVHGRITTAMDNGQLEARIGWKIQPATSTVMLCGNPAMLDDMEAGLNQRGLKKHKKKEPGQIVIERYW
jgi:ferredoxin--NADP+ reductase